MIEIGEDFFKDSPEDSIVEYIQSFGISPEEILSQEPVIRGGLAGASLCFRSRRKKLEMLLEYLSCSVNQKGRGISISVAAPSPHKLESVLKLPEVKCILDSLQVHHETA